MNWRFGRKKAKKRKAYGRTAAKTGATVRSPRASLRSPIQSPFSRISGLPVFAGYPFFTRSDLSNGVQLADLPIHNVHRAFKGEDLRHPYFESMLPRLYRRQNGATLDGSKVWPEHSPLVRAARPKSRPYKECALLTEGG